MNKLTYKIYTLGCKVNQYDSGIIASRLRKKGFQKSEQYEADLVLVNTCAVTQVAIKKAKRIIAKAKKENPQAKFILIGCYPKVYAKTIDKGDFDFIAGTNEGEKVLERIFEMFQLSEQDLKNVVISKSGRVRYTLKIQDGCEQFCSYCIIPYTRGGLSSRGMEEVMEEFREVLKQGYREIVLSGIHLGLYGVDLSKKNLLISLIRDMLSEPGNFRLRLSSIEVNELSDELIDLIKSEAKICSHLHIPLQSGSNKILKIMRRPYTSEYFEEKLRKIRKKIPLIAITGDVIIGFPGENDNDFQKTFDFISRNKFAKLHIFPFSLHEKTRAALLPDRVEVAVKKKRVEVLKKKADNLRKEYKNNFKHKRLEVLLEKKQDKKCVGKSQYYFNVEFCSDKAHRGDIVKVSDWKFVNK